MGRLAVALVLMGAAAVGFAQEAKTTLALPPAPLLPATLGNLTRVEAGDSGDGLGALDAADPDDLRLGPQGKAVLEEDGLKRFARRSIRRTARLYLKQGRGWMTRSMAR